MRSNQTPKKTNQAPQRPGMKPSNSSQVLQPSTAKAPQIPANTKSIHSPPAKSESTQSPMSNTRSVQANPGSRDTQKPTKSPVPISQFDQAALQKRFQGLLTRKGVLCRGYRVTQDKSKVRMSAGDFSEAVQDKSSKTRIFEERELVDFILENARQEDEAKESKDKREKEAASAIIKDMMSLLKKKTKKEARKTKEMALNCVKLTLKERFTEFLERANEPGFEERVEELLREEESIGVPWRKKLLDELTVTINQLERNVVTMAEEARRALKDILSEKNIPVSKPKQAANAKNQAKIKAMEFALPKISSYMTEDWSLLLSCQTALNCLVPVKVMKLERKLMDLEMEKESIKIVKELLFEVFFTLTLVNRIPLWFHWSCSVMLMEELISFQANRICQLRNSMRSWALFL